MKIGFKAATYIGTKDRCVISQQVEDLRINELVQAAKTGISNRSQPAYIVIDRGGISQIRCALLTDEDAKPLLQMQALKKAVLRDKSPKSRDKQEIFDFAVEKIDRIIVNLQKIGILKAKNQFRDYSKSVSFKGIKLKSKKTMDELPNDRKVREEIYIDEQERMKRKDTYPCIYQEPESKDIYFIELTGEDAEPLRMIDGFLDMIPGITRTQKEDEDGIMSGYFVFDDDLSSDAYFLCDSTVSNAQRLKKLLKKIAYQTVIEEAESKSK